MQIFVFWEKYCIIVLAFKILIIWSHREYDSYVPRPLNVCLTFIFPPLGKSLDYFVDENKRKNNIPIVT